LQWQILLYIFGHVVYFLPFGLFCGHLACYMVIWNSFPRFRIMYQGKSGSPESVIRRLSF
jgi:hypothetical protein